MRPTLALCTFTLVATALAGCIGQSGEPLQPAGRAVGGSLTVPDVVAEGAEIIKHADAVEVVWQGAAGPALPPSPLGVPFVGSPSGIANSVLGPPIDHRFELPKEVTVVEATLTWSTADVNLNLAVREDRDGRLLTQCRSVFGLEDEPATERCKAYKVAARDVAEQWLGRVSIASNPGGLASPEPFELRLNLSVKPYPLLGPALAMEQRSPSLSFVASRVDEEHRSGEPSLKVDGEGNVYIAAPTGRMQSLWRTTDGTSYEWIDIEGNTAQDDVVGQAWKTQLPTCGNPPPVPNRCAVGVGGGDSEVYVTADGKELYYADLWGTCITTGYSADAGQTWRVNPLSCDVPMGNDRQWIWALPGGHLWMNFNGPSLLGMPQQELGMAGGHIVMHSIDGGATWLTRTLIPEDMCARGNLAVTEDGHVYAAGCNEDGPGLGVSEDMGQTFTWVTIAERSGEPLDGFCYVCGIFTVVDIDTEGNPYAVWADPSPDGEAFRVWFSHSDDHGKSWSEPVQVNQAEGNALLPWIAAGEPGHVQIAWYQTKEMGKPSEVEGEWYVHLAESTTAHDARPVFHETLAWDMPVQYGPLCITGSACQTARNLLDFLMVDIGADGRGHLAFIDGGHGGSAANSFVMYAKQTLGIAPAPASASPASYGGAPRATA